MIQIPVKEVIEKYLTAQKKSNIPAQIITRNEAVLLDFFQYTINDDFEISVFDKRKGRG